MYIIYICHVEDNRADVGPLEYFFIGTEPKANINRRTRCQYNEEVNEAEIEPAVSCTELFSDHLPPLFKLSHVLIEEVIVTITACAWFEEDGKANVDSPSEDVGCD